jgi:hypothetical protein
MQEIAMPNRKTFDDREKYDHSSHGTTSREKGDLAPASNQVEEDTPKKDPRATDSSRPPVTPRPR